MESMEHWFGLHWKEFSLLGAVSTVSIPFLDVYSELLAAATGTATLCLVGLSIYAKIREIKKK